MFGIFPFLFSASVFASWGMFVINKTPTLLASVFTNDGLQIIWCSMSRTPNPYDQIKSPNLFWRFCLNSKSTTCCKTKRVADGVMIQSELFSDLNPLWTRNRRHAKKRVDDQRRRMWKKMDETSKLSHVRESETNLIKSVYQSLSDYASLQKYFGADCDGLQTFLKPPMMPTFGNIKMRNASSLLRQKITFWIMFDQMT